MDRIVHGVTILTCALHEAPTISCDNQIAALQALHQAIQRWAKLTFPAQTNPHITTPPPTITRQRSVLRPMRRLHEDQPQYVPPRVVINNPNASPIPTTVTSTTSNYEPFARRTRSRVPQTLDQPPPRVSKTPDTGPIARCTRSQTAAMANVITLAQAAQRRCPSQFLQSLAMPVLNENSGQSLQYCQLCKHPKFAHIWNTSYANELGRLCQGIGQGSKGPKHQRVEGTNTFRIIKFEDIPQDRRR